MSGPATDAMIAAMHASFERCARFVTARAQGAEVLSASLAGEHSDFVRFNHGRIRQAGRVLRVDVTIRLVEGQRSATASVVLPGTADADDAALQAGLDACRALVATAVDDPWLPASAAPSRSMRIASAALPMPSEVERVVRQAAGDADLVGFLASGAQCAAMASSEGHDHFHARASWSFEFTVHGPALGSQAAAVKGLVAGTDWAPERIEQSVVDARARLAVLARPPVDVARGEHRALLAPSAVSELVEMLGWNGFSERALRTGQSPLMALRSGERCFDPRVSLHDDLELAGAPLFLPEGFVRPPRVVLLDAGRMAGALVSPRTAREFSVESNHASEHERPAAWSMAAGNLPEAQAMEALGTGLALSNLWYLNYSDRQTCRITGMTRFATVWVRDGEPIGPVRAMRFDDSLYRLLGSELEALTDSARWLPDTSSYDGRTFGGARVPGALVRSMRFTL